MFADDSRRAARWRCRHLASCCQQRNRHFEPWQRRFRRRKRMPMGNTSRHRLAHPGGEAASRETEGWVGIRTSQAPAGRYRNLILNGESRAPPRCSNVLGHHYAHCAARWGWVLLRCQPTLPASPALWANLSSRLPALEVSMDLRVISSL